MAEHLESLDTLHPSPHDYLFGREERVESIDDLIKRNPPLKFVKDTAGVIEALSEREVQDFVDLYSTSTEEFNAQHIKDRYARRKDRSITPVYDESREDIGLAKEIATELQGEINRKIDGKDEGTPLLQVLFPR